MNFLRGKKILLIIDPQNDFMDFVEKYEPSLSVSGASNDMNKLAIFLEQNPKLFDEIHVSLDSHTVNHIGHESFWSKDKKWKPNVFEHFYVYEGDPKIYVGKSESEKRETKTADPHLHPWAYHYILEMKKEKKPIPCLWPTHCILGEKGWQIYEPLKTVLMAINLKKKNVFYHEKGTNDLVEMYSIFKAEKTYEEILEKISRIDHSTAAYIKYKFRDIQITAESETEVDSCRYCYQIPDLPNEIRNYKTGLNEELLNRLFGKYRNNKIYVCGEAKDYCVRASLEDMIRYGQMKNMEKPNSYLLKNIYLMNHFTSFISEDIPEHVTEPISVINESTIEDIADSVRGLHVVSSKQQSKFFRCFSRGR